MAQIVSPPTMQDACIHALPASRALYERARKLFPDAVTHDNRRMQPFPVYVERADGARPTGSCASMVRSGGKARKSLPRQMGCSACKHARMFRR